MIKTVSTFLFIVIVGLIFSEVNFQVAPLAIGQYLTAEIGSAIGASASVPPNPYNTLAKQLHDRELALDQREQLIANKESSSANQKDTLILLYMAAAGLLVFVSIHIYIDHRRKNQIVQEAIHE